MAREGGERVGGVFMFSVSSVDKLRRQGNSGKTKKRGKGVRKKKKWSMPKRSRSVLHAYLFSHPEHARESKRQNRETSHAAETHPGAVCVTDVPECGNMPPFFASDLGGAAFDVHNRQSHCAAGDCGEEQTEGGAFAAGDVFCCLSRGLGDKDVEGPDDHSVSLDEPFIPEPDRLVGVPPSCRSVQEEPNWLERAVMRARCPGRRFGLSNSHGERENVPRMALPDPSWLHLGVVVGGEDHRAVAAITNITAAFYASRRPEKISALLHACVSSRAY